MHELSTFFSFSSSSRSSPTFVPLPFIPSRPLMFTLLSSISSFYLFLSSFSFLPILLSPSALYVLPTSPSLLLLPLLYSQLLLFPATPWIILPSFLISYVCLPLPLSLSILSPHIFLRPSVLSSRLFFYPHPRMEGACRVSSHQVS